MKFVLPAILSLAACTTEAVQPDYTVEGIPVDESQVQLAVNETISAYVAAHKSHTYGDIHAKFVAAHVTLRFESSFTCARGENCDGQDDVNSGVIQVIYQPAQTGTCLANTRLTHELIHQIAYLATGNADAEHADVSLWGDYRGEPLTNVRYASLLAQAAKVQACAQK